MEKRDGFHSGIGFVLAAAGSSVGLGNLWSFPYKTSQNGGASFVIVYVLSVIVLGSLLCIGEIFIGKWARSNPVTAYKKINKFYGFAGLIGIVGSFIIMTYYSVLGGYTLKFTVNSFQDQSDALLTFSANTWEAILFTGIFILLCAIIISLGVKRGIENASKILMPVLIIILVGIVIYCLCLGEGVKEGLNYYLNPDFTKLGFKGALAAMSQAFFSLSVGLGILSVYGSYMGEKIKVGRSVFWIAFFDTLVALLAGLAIFPAIFHHQAKTGVALQESGIVLLFSSMPLVFAKLGIAGKIISFFFFGMVSIAAITSVISLLEGAAQFVSQTWKIKRLKVVIVLALVCFLFSVPVAISLGQGINGGHFLSLGDRNLLEVLDTMVNSLLIPIGALALSVAIGWLFLRPKDRRNLFRPTLLAKKLKEEGLDLGKFTVVFAFMLQYIAPLGILFIEATGIVDAIWPEVGGSRVFSSEGLIIILLGIALMGILFVLYLLVFMKRDTGCNDDEERIEAKASSSNNE